MYHLLDAVDVTRIADSLQRGQSIKGVAAAMGCSARTIRRWKAKLIQNSWCPRLAWESSAGGGGGRGVTPSERVRIDKRRKEVERLVQVKQVDGDWVRFPFGSCRAAQKQLARQGTRVSHVTVFRDLKAVDLVSRVRPKAPSRRQQDIKKRDKWTNEYANLDIDLTAWTDESYPSCNHLGVLRHQWVYRKGGLAATRESQRWPIRIGIWAAIWPGGRRLVILPRQVQKKNKKRGRPRKVKLGRPPKSKKTKPADERQKTVDHVVYLNKCIKPFTNRLVKDRLILQQDGATAHWARDVIDYFHAKKIRYIRWWPPHSPDLNPIEELWGLLSKRVAQNHAPSTEKQLEKAVRVEFAAIPQSQIDALCRRFARKRDAVRAAKGGFVRVGKERKNARKAAKKASKKGQ